MNYIDSNLAKDERVVARIKHSWVGLISVTVISLFFIVFGIVVFFIPEIISNAINEKIKDGFSVVMLKVLGVTLMVFGVSYFLGQFFEIKCAQLVLTNKRMFGRRGLFAKRTVDILLSKIDTINISNGFFGAIFHYGSIQIISAGIGTMTRAERAAYIYPFVANTTEFRNAVLQTIDKVKEEERLAQAKSLSEAINQQ